MSLLNLGQHNYWLARGTMNEKSEKVFCPAQTSLKDIRAAAEQQRSKGTPRYPFPLEMMKAFFEERKTIKNKKNCLQCC